MLILKSIIAGDSLRGSELGDDDDNSEHEDAKVAPLDNFQQQHQTQPSQVVYLCYIYS